LIHFYKRYEILFIAGAGSGQHAEMQSPTGRGWSTGHRRLFAKRM